MTASAPSSRQNSAFYIGADGHDDLHAEVARDLDRGRADAGAAAVDEQPFAGLHLSAADDVRPDGRQHLGQGGRLGEVEVIRDWKQLTCGNGHVFGVSAAGEQSRHPVADGPTGDVGAELLDRAGDLEPGNQGRPGWGIVESAALQQVGPVDAGGMDADEDFIGGDVWCGFVGDLQDLGLTGGGDRDSAHASTLVAGCASGQGHPRGGVRGRAARDGVRRRRVMRGSTLGRYRIPAIEYRSLSDTFELQKCPIAT
jgi:ribosomal protein S6E (S10)